MTERSTSAFEHLWRGRVDRRAFLLGGIAVVAAGALPRARGRVRWASDPFTLGVASGDPASDGVVLWTRLAPEPLNGGGISEPVVVTWEVGDDAGMR
jgi:alkaline phosphatase D